ncbi:hypothetical protein N7537_006014 [Penicillium hordei]|uniref:Uncharacterized protein n=1 Tax=Penicillium hordei TaxID=40994 RepID=A0AAD6E6T1_9EURO|nr:uncharacterized protein N7537_006014 [Penicillium hordei]KAJ5603058.1 hypothetical protein N7537_006014 [Penicillium hordei]
MWRTYKQEGRAERLIVGLNIELFNLHLSIVLIIIIAKLRHCDGKANRKKKQNKTNRHFSPRSLAKTDPPRSHSSGLDSVLVSSLTFFFCAI